MRTSILSRSVLAIASLAIGSVALAAAPATAATPAVTRDLVLTAANGMRITDPTQAQFKTTYKAIQRIAVRTCDTDEELGYFVTPIDATPIATTGDVDGLLIRAYVMSFAGFGEECTFAAFATTDPKFQLSGSARISGFKTEYDDEGNPVIPDGAVAKTLRTATLSGGVYVTAPLDASNYQELIASASGNATKTTAVTTSTKVSTPKSKAVKKAAKSKYDKQLKAAKKSYAKAVKKAGNNKSKKAAAKKTYASKKKAAKASYNKAIATFKIAMKTTSSTEKRPFSVTTAKPKAP